MLTITERRVLAAIDDQAILRTLQALLAVPSLGGSTAERQVQEVAAAALAAQGLAVETWELELPALQAHPRYPGQEVVRQGALGVLATYGAGGGPRLILNGHLDVVPAGDEALWRHSPWSGALHEGRVFGRGACDMKGGVASIIHAAGAIAAAGVRLQGTLHVQTVIGEEDGGLGSFDAALRGPRADGAIIAEPTSLQPVLAQAGALTFRLRVAGRAAHGALRLEGHSAVDAYYGLHRALQELEATRNASVEHALMARLPLPYPISIGTVRAGEWSSTVPEALVAEGRFGVAVGEEVEAARAALEAAVTAAAARDLWLCEHPPDLEWWGGQFAPAEIPAEHALVRSLESAMAEEGRAMAPVGVPYGSDMRLLAHVGGTPALLFGPGDVRLAHQRDESVPLAELAEAARTIALAALRFCGYER